MYSFDRYLNIRSATTPIFDPTGQRIAFLSDISGNFQVWSSPVQTGQAAWPQQLTFFEDKVWELYGTKAAPHLIAASDAGGNERQQLYLITGYGSDRPDQGFEVRRLTGDERAIHRFGAFHPDGWQIVYTSNSRNGVDFDSYRLDLNSGEVECIYQADGNRAIVAWSPDGRFLLTIDSVGPLQSELYLFDFQSGRERHLTDDTSSARYGQFRWTRQGLYLISDRFHDRSSLCRLNVETAEVTPLLDAPDRGGELELLALDPDGQAAYTLNVDGYSQLYLTALDNRSSPVHLVDIPAGLISALHFSPDGQQLALALQTPNHNPDIWLIAAAEGAAARQITFSNRAGIPQSSYVLPELIRYPTFDGIEIPAFYYLPQQPAPAAGFPCILYVHGGPTSQVWPDFDVRFQYFLNQGYAVLAPNVRGSSGYGRAYAALDEIEKRLDSVADLKEAVTWLQARPEIDGQRLAIYGRSYGGFMVLAALTEYPGLFAAGIDVVGISNWVTFLERTSQWRRAHREREYGSLAHHRDVLERLSPIHKAEHIQVPLLVMAGDNDPRVPLSESEQIVERIRAAGGEVKFIHYADEGHKISKLANRIDSFTQMAQFLQEHL